MPGKNLRTRRIEEKIEEISQGVEEKRQKRQKAGEGEGGHVEKKRAEISSGFPTSAEQNFQKDKTGAQQQSWNPEIIRVMPSTHQRKMISNL